jgi:hypothetical protein
MGGIFNPVNLNAYQYVFNNPVVLVDPDGNAPNQDGTTNPSHLLDEVKKYEAQGLSNEQILTSIARSHVGNKNRYFFTARYGWVDIRHFATAALYSKKYSRFISEFLGFGNEVKQWLHEWGNDYRSGFSHEDMKSNAAGAQFGSKLKKNENMSKVLSEWLDFSGAKEHFHPDAERWRLPVNDPALRGGKNNNSNVIDRGRTGSGEHPNR